MSKLNIEELQTLLAAATPGPWAEEAMWGNSSGRRYRDSQVIASNPLHPSHMDRTIAICDTLNAWHCFSEEDREANMKLICALYNAAPALLALALEREPCPDFAKLIAEALKEQGCTTGNAPGFTVYVYAPASKVVSAVLSVAAMAAFRPQGEYVAGREANIRMAAIEECAKVAENYAREHANGAMMSIAESMHGEAAGNDIASELRALAQQPPAKEGE